MQTQNRLLDDLARVTSGAMGVAAGVRGEIEARVREQLERILAQMDLVPREEFEVVKAIAAKARAEQEVLAERVERLEALLAEKDRKPAAASRSAKGRAKKTTGKAGQTAKTAAKAGTAEDEAAKNDG